MSDKLTSNQQEALEWCRARESFLHVEFRRAGFTGPTIYSLRKRGLLEFDSATCRYRPIGVAVPDQQTIRENTPMGPDQ